MKNNKHVILLLCLVISTIIYGQTYISPKQSYLNINKDQNLETFFDTKRKIIISGNSFIFELPEDILFEGEFTLDTISKKTKYQIKGGGFFQISPRKIFLNIHVTEHRKIIIFYINDGYEKGRLEQEKRYQELTHKSFVKTLGKFTADCIKNKTVKLGMSRIAIVLILGQANNIETNETLNQTNVNYYYTNMSIYTKNGIVTEIQSSY